MLHHVVIFCTGSRLLFSRIGTRTKMTNTCMQAGQYQHKKFMNWYIPAFTVLSIQCEMHHAFFVCNIKLYLLDTRVARRMMCRKCFCFLCNIQYAVAYSDVFVIL